MSTFLDLHALIGYKRALRKKRRLLQAEGTGTWHASSVCSRKATFCLLTESMPNHACHSFVPRRSQRLYCIECKESCTLQHCGICGAQVEGKFTSLSNLRPQINDESFSTNDVRFCHAGIQTFISFCDRSASRIHRTAPTPLDQQFEMGIRLKISRIIPSSNPPL